MKTRSVPNISRRLPSVHLRLPSWVGPFLSRYGRVPSEPRCRMEFVLHLCRLNVVHGTGGPFAAAVFEVGSDRFVAAGVNLVEPMVCSAAHAEIVALSIAQQVRGQYDLGAAGSPPCELVSSTEPCAMCLGAIPWSGVRNVVCGARDADARAVGFDEGAKPRNWVQALRSRGIHVRRDVLRREAAAILRDYATAGGAIYNGRKACHP